MEKVAGRPRANEVRVATGPTDVTSRSWYGGPALLERGRGRGARRTAATAAPIAATASARPDPAGGNGPASSSTRPRSNVNATRNRSALPEALVTQPRTVETGRPSRAAIRRYPTPSTRSSNAAPTTSTPSARRPSVVTGASTWVRPQPPHRPRRGMINSATVEAIGEETSRLMGSFVLAAAWQAATGRVRLPESERRDAMAYVDEAHNFLTLPGSVGDMLAEARGYHFGMTLAHQHLAQMPRDTQLAISANAP